MDPSQQQCFEALSNATTAYRHAAMRAAIESSVGTPTATTRVLVMNTVDRHYDELIAPWAAMVSAAPFEKRVFVVAMDSQAARAAQLPPHAVAAAYDALVVPLWAPDRDKPVLPPEALSPSPSHSSSSPTPLGDEADEGWQSIGQGQYASELADAQDW